MITSILYFVLALGILVFVHELGHFLVAKWSGIRVERFSLGYPPKMIGFQYGETEYCLSWIPFGGYVKVAGMADIGSEESSGEPWEFPSKPIWIRMAVIVAGPVMNFIFAFFAFFTIYSVFGIDTVVSTIVEPVQSSVSELAGIRRGDVIRSVDGQAVANELQLRSAIEGTESRGVTVEVNRDGASYSFELGASEEDFYGLQVLIPTTVGTVSDDMPAATIGLIQGDRITSVDGIAVHSWSDMKREISAHPDIQVALRWRRGETLMESPITPIARADGDISDNAPLEAARELQVKTESRIRELEEMLRRTEVVKPGSNKGGIRIGSQVVLHDVGGAKDTAYTLVDTAEANPTLGKISQDSPLGRAVLGRKKGDEVVVQAPKGDLRYRIVSIGG